MPGRRTGDAKWRPKWRAAAPSWRPEPLRAGSTPTATQRGDAEPLVAAGAAAGGRRAIHRKVSPRAAGLGGRAQFCAAAEGWQHHRRPAAALGRRDGRSARTVAGSRGTSRSSDGGGGSSDFASSQATHSDPPAGAITPGSSSAAADGEYGEDRSPLGISGVEQHEGPATRRVAAGPQRASVGAAGGRLARAALRRGGDAAGGGGRLNRVAAAAPSATGGSVAAAAAEEEEAVDGGADGGRRRRRGGGGGGATAGVLRDRSGEKSREARRGRPARAPRRQEGIARAGMVLPRVPVPAAAAAAHRCL